MSESGDFGSVFPGESLERSKEEVLAAAKPLPPDDEAVIEDLTEEEDRIFLDAILNA